MQYLNLQNVGQNKQSVMEGLGIKLIRMYQFRRSLYDIPELNSSSENILANHMIHVKARDGKSST